MGWRPRQQPVLDLQLNILRQLTSVFVQRYRSIYMKLHVANGQEGTRIGVPFDDEPFRIISLLGLLTSDDYDNSYNSSLLQTGSDLIRQW